MTETRKWSNRVVGVGVLMAAIAFPHLIDDFLYGIPEEFGLTDPQCQVLAGVFSVILLAAFAGAARGAGWAYASTGFIGGFLSLAVILKHIPRMLLPAPYWSGAFSEFLIWGLLVSSLVLLVVSVLALRNMKKTPT